MFFAGSHSTIFAAALTHSYLLSLLLYADPGSGTLVWQLLLAAFFGGMFYFRRFREFLFDLWKQSNRTQWKRKRLALARSVDSQTGAKESN